MLVQNYAMYRSLIKKRDYIKIVFSFMNYQNIEECVNNFLNVQVPSNSAFIELFFAATQDIVSLPSQHYLNINKKSFAHP